MCTLIGTYGLTTKRDDKKIRLYSNNFKDIGVIEFDLYYLNLKKNMIGLIILKELLKPLKTMVLIFLMDLTY